MKKAKSFLATLWIAAVISLLYGPAGALEKGRIITAGDFFPEFSFPMTLAKSDIEYLGLPQKFFGLIKGDSFSLKQIKAELIVLEYLNKYCFSCQIQVTSMNQVFNIVETNPQLKGRIKFLAIGAGNNQREVDSFRAEHKITFPIIPDPKFLAYEAIGDPGATPFTLFIRKTDSGHLVAHTQVGLTTDPGKLMGDLNDSLRTDVDALLKQYKDPSLQQAKAQKLRVPFSEKELMKKAQESMARPKWKVLQAAKIALPDGEEIYVGEIQTGAKKSYLFTKLVSRAPTCDICHVTHFFFTFDEKGEVVNFLPLQITKDYNRSWTEKEVEQMRKRLVGRSILQPVDFDPQVDSISSATMTAALIVDSVNKAKGLYEGLKSKGYIK
jgi:hypothetical protein